MTTFRIITTFFIFIIGTSFQANNDKVVFRGQLLVRDSSFRDILWGLNVVMKSGQEIIAISYIDSIGHFELSFKKSYKNVDLFVTGIGIDTSFIHSFETIPSDTFNFKTRFPKSRKTRISLRTKYPKCRKANKVYPIIYGDGQLVTRIVINGDTLLSPIVKRKYYAGTCIHSTIDPNWYCDRDKIKFY